MIGRKMRKSLKTYQMTRAKIIDYGLMGFSFEIWRGYYDNFLIRIDAIDHTMRDRTILWRRPSSDSGKFAIYDTEEAASLLYEYYMVRRAVPVFYLDRINRGEDIGQIDQWPPGPLFDFGD